jgi:ADP-ribose pyrophosphatase YjhB (NUDIX family)
MELSDYLEQYGANLTLRTLCFLVRGDEVVLAMKKRGFGQGKWNGAGGKVEEGEEVERATIRETEEEFSVTPRALEKVAIFDYFFADAPEDKKWNQQVHVYLCREWEGEPTESEEMAPRWFPISAIPFQEMWDGDNLWLPRLLVGEKLSAAFLFEGETIKEYEMTAVDSLPSL